MRLPPLLRAVCVCVRTERGTEREREGERASKRERECVSWGLQEMLCLRNKGKAEAK